MIAQPTAVITNMADGPLAVWAYPQRTQLATVPTATSALGDALFLEVPAREDQQLEGVTQPARVIEQVAHGDRRAVIGQLGNEPPHVIVERHPAIADELEHGECGWLVSPPTPSAALFRRSSDAVGTAGRAAETACHFIP